MKFSGFNTTTKIGIGTNSPARTLDVQGPVGNDDVIAIRHASGGSSWLKLGFWNGTTERASIRTQDDASHVSIFCSTTERLRIMSDGNVGIGTTAPNNLLHVYNNTAGTASEIKIENATANYNAALQIKTTASVWDVGSNIVAAAGSFEVYERTSGSTGGRFTILSGGNVGIGTTAPSAKIHVAGTGDVARIGDNHWRGTNTVTVGTTYVTGVTVNLANHKSGYLKVIISGDWSGHSAIGYMSEYFIQKGSTTRYSQPGTVIREVTNQHNSDYITSQILDPTLNDGNADFAIQFKTNTGSVSCTVMYEFTGIANSVT